MLQGDGGHIFISLNSQNHGFVLNPVVLKPIFNVPVPFGGPRKGAVTLTDVVNTGVLSHVMVSLVPGPALEGTCRPTCSTEATACLKAKRVFWGGNSDVAWLEYTR